MTSCSWIDAPGVKPVPSKIGKDFMTLNLLTQEVISPIFESFKNSLKNYINMKKSIRRIIRIGGFMCLLILIRNCDKLGSTGVCTGYSAEYNSTYCKDGWTKAECDEWDALEVNGVSWTFYRGQTCDDRGTPATP
jgi:hypothetical protein